MTPLQTSQALTLRDALPPGHDDRRWVARWATTAEQSPLREMPDMDAVRLGELVHQWRHRLTEEQHRELCGACRGSEPLFATAEVKHAR